MVAQFNLRFLMLSLLAAVLAVPSPAQAQILTVPFEPELGVPYFYEMQSWKEGDEGRKSDVTLVQSITYEKIDTGYTLTLENKRAYVGQDRRRVRELGPFVDLFGEVILELDSDGFPVRVGNWEAIKERLVNAIPAMAAASESDPAKRTQAEAFFRNFMGKYTSLTAEESITSAIKHWPSLLGYGGASFEVGATFEDVSEQPGPLIETPIKRTTRYTLLSANEATFTFEAKTFIGSAQLAGLVEELLSDVSGAEHSMPEDVRQEFEDNGYFLEALVTEHDATSGLIVNAQIDRGMGSSWERVRIRRIEE